MRGARRHLDAAIIDAKHEDGLTRVRSEGRDGPRLVAEVAGLQADVDRSGARVPDADGAVLGGREHGAPIVDEGAVRDVGRMRREDLHNVALWQLPHPSSCILRAGEEHLAARVPREPRHALRRALEGDDERTALGVPHAHGAVEPSAREQGAVCTEAERRDGVGVALELAQRRRLADAPHVADVIAAARRYDLGLRGVDGHGEDRPSVRLQLLHAVVLVGRRQLLLGILHVNRRRCDGGGVAVVQKGALVVAQLARAVLWSKHELFCYVQVLESIDLVRKFGS